MSSVDWGDAPTWIAGLFAGAAAIYTRGMLKSQRNQIGEQREFIADQVGFMAEQRNFIAEQREFMAEQSATLALERAELAAAAEERRCSQAKQVSMIYRATGSQPDGAGGFRGYDKWVVTVQNGSDAPLRQVRIRFGQSYMATESVEQESTHLPDRGRRPATVDTLGPGRSLSFWSPAWQETTVDNNPPTCLFTDADGAHWRLDHQGSLTADE